MRTVLRLWFLLSALAVGAQDSALVDTNGVLVHPTNFISANGIAPLASPALSGNPTAPTATAGDNDTSISTTAFVTAAIEALKALQLWQDTNAVLTRLAGIGAGVSGDIIYRDATGWTNRASGTAAFSAATDFQATNANLTTIAGLTGGNASNFFRGTGAFMQVTTNDVTGLPALIAAQLKDAPLNTTTYARSNGVWTTNLPASQLAGLVSTSNLPGLLSGLSVGDGGGVVTNLAFPQTYWFTNQGTTTNWTIPTGARSLFICAVGGGGGGGSGRRYASGTIASGGGGGGGGAYAQVLVGDVNKLGTNVIAITIPAISVGAESVTTDYSNGTTGVAGGIAWVNAGNADTTSTNVIIRATGGGAGVGGDGDGSTGGSGGTIGTFAGSAGGASSTTGLVGNAGTTANIGFGAVGGGAGGGITAAGTPSAGGDGGLGPRDLLPNGVGSAGGIGANGTNFSTSWRPTIASFLLHGWPGAGGGGSSTNSAGGNGADGYGWGSGGGGGGASLNGFASGKGGNGGPSAVSITVYCACPAIAAPEWIGAAVRWAMDAVSFIRHVGIPLLEMSKEQVNQ